MKNILVIGETGVGKSSLINLVVGKSVATISDNTTGATFNNEKHRFKNCNLIDTISYNNAFENSATEALSELARFAMTIKSEGISLIIYVMRKSRITAASRKNYDYFVKTFCRNQVPVLLVVTHCENDTTEETDEWYFRERERFKEFGMIFAGTVCGCAIDLERSAEAIEPELIPGLTLKRSRTQHQVRIMIEQTVLSVPWQPSNWTEWIGKIIYSVAMFLGIPCVTLLDLLGYVAYPLVRLEAAIIDVIKQALRVYVRRIKYKS